MKKHILSIFTTLLFCTGFSGTANAQSCYELGGCSNFANFAYNSETFEDGTGTAAATLEYDNFVSGFHSTVVRDQDGSFKIWGEAAAQNGTTDVLVPTEINAANYTLLTGVPLKVAMASNSINSAQFVMLTDDDKLWVWGDQSVLIMSGLTTLRNFQQLSLGLPPGVTSSDVKMMFGSYRTLAITTCSGEVWVLANLMNNRGAGSGSSSATTWSQVKKEDGTPLTGIVATRGTGWGLMALDADGDVWTWGQRTYLGDGSSYAGRNAATKMTLPAHTGTIKMIGMTIGSSSTSYYILYEDGNLFSMGHNGSRQLGDFTTTLRREWIQPLYASGGAVMDDIAWISVQEHDWQTAAINAINNNKELWNWGTNESKMLGRPGTGTVNPGKPEEWATGYSNESIIAVETGGHTTMVLRECENNFGYVGHRVNGSMGNGDVRDAREETFTFNTAAVELCGASTTPLVQNLEICPNTFANLEDALLTFVPVGTTVEWWTTPDRTPGTQVTDPAAVPAGTTQYYAFFIVDNPSACAEAPASEAVLVSELTGEAAADCEECNAGTDQVSLSGNTLTND